MQCAVVQSWMRTNLRPKGQIFPWLQLIHKNPNGHNVIQDHHVTARSSVPPLMPTTPLSVRTPVLQRRFGASSHVHRSISDSWNSVDLVLDDIHMPSPQTRSRDESDGLAHMEQKFSLDVVILLHFFHASLTNTQDNSISKSAVRHFEMHIKNAMNEDPKEHGMTPHWGWFHKCLPV